MSGSNFHTHTLFCDGKNTPREMAERAIELGCPQLGFSGHSYTETGDETPYCMSVGGTAEYKKEIRALQREFRDQIEILLGVERDYFSADETEDYDYVIGSVHYVFKDGAYLPIDESKEMQKKIVREHYDGDFYAFAEDYYRLVGEVDQKTKCDIVGHFDLITKFNEDHALFDPNHPRYVAAADGALKRLMNKGLIFEINYGAISRGYRSTPYPEPRLLEALRQNGEKTLSSSDCHNKEHLLLGIEENNAFHPKPKEKKTQKPE